MNKMGLKCAASNFSIISWRKTVDKDQLYTAVLHELHSRPYGNKNRDGLSLERHNNATVQQSAYARKRKPCNSNLMVENSNTKVMADL